MEPEPTPIADNLTLGTEAAATKSYRFSRGQKLRGRGTFKAILDQGHRKWLGPIGMSIAANEAGVPRLGISIGRPVGNAAVRNRIKRKLREAFRLMQHDWPATFDVVILVKKHDPMTLAEYQRHLSHLMVRCVKKRAEA